MADPAIALTKLRRRIASPKHSERAMVAGQTGRLEVVKTALECLLWSNGPDRAHRLPKSTPTVRGDAINFGRVSGSIPILSRPQFAVFAAARFPTARD
jgi:hypothetical protein